MPRERFAELELLNGILLTEHVEKGTLIKVLGK
jgi:hypothetical protein